MHERFRPDRVPRLRNATGLVVLHILALHAVVSEGAGERSIREGMLQDGLGKWLILPANAATAAAITVFSGDRRRRR